MMIEVEGLTRYYGEFPAVQDVSFSIGERVIVGFLGLNGAGKSTVLKVLGGLLMPSAGKVTIGGVDAIDAPDSLREKIGFLPEDPPLYDDMRVNDFLVWCGEIKGLDRARAEKRLPEVLRICQLDEVAGRVIGTLSHGYKKRVGIAQAIIHEPELVILDEPISGLDPVQIVDMRKVLRELKKTCTVLISSHILSEISQTCDRVLVLHGGQIVAEGSETDLKGRLEAAVRIELTLRGDIVTVDEVAAALDSIVSIETHEIQDGLIRAEVQFSGDQREELVQKLVAAGVGIRGVREDVSSKLEDVFLGLTKDGGGQTIASRLVKTDARVGDAEDMISSQEEE